MKLKTIFLFILLMVGTHLTGMAEPTTQSNNRIILQRKRVGDNIKRPKSPDIQMITCAYDSKGMELTFAMSEGLSTFIVLDSEKQGGVYTIDTSSPEVYVVVGELSSPIHVQLETERGAVYEGKFEY
ncbi:MAG: hypothetical protein K2K93_04035 [Muribaculaceae bacterium]|nr:hypothetical protein [Muribaculaceae bacterium]